MLLSNKERDRRYSELRKRMKELGVEILLVLADTGDAGLRYSNVRYLTNFRIVFGNGVLIFPLEGNPLFLVFSTLGAKKAKELSWIKDVREYNFNLVSEVIQSLQSMQRSWEKIGVAYLSTLPISLHQALRQAFPSADLIEMGPVIEKLRYLKSEEEIKLIQGSARLADKAFAEVVKVIKPGMTQFEVAASLEKPMREEGGEDFFDLFFSGPFGPGVGIDCYAPTDRKIKAGDVLLMEITPRYGGYWAQLVRIVCIGKENKELVKFHRVARDAITAGIRHFKPGMKLGSAAQEAKETVESAGLELHPPMGHLCGLDLIEARVKLESEEILQPGAVVIFHPPVYSGKTSIFWGETYVITSKGYRRLHNATDELLVV